MITKDNTYLLPHPGVIVVKRPECLEQMYSDVVEIHVIDKQQLCPMLPVSQTIAVPQGHGQPGQKVELVMPKRVLTKSQACYRDLPNEPDLALVSLDDVLAWEWDDERLIHMSKKNDKN